MLDRRKGGALERASRLLDLPGDIIAGLPRIQVVGYREVLIENHKGILLYESSDIHIACGEATVKLRGDGLLIAAMNASEMLVRGQLFGIDFEF